MSNSNFKNLAEITEQLTELADQHRELALKNTELNTHLRAAETRRVEDLACIAHELKKPLAVIRGLLAQLMNSKEHKIGDEIDVEVSRAAELLDGIMTLSQLATNKTTIPQKISLSQICQTIFTQQSLLHAQHEWCSQIAHNVEIIAVPEHIFAVLENLLENAAKHTPESGIVELTLAQLTDEIRLSVRDNGRGLTPDEQKRILTPFCRLSAQPGRGLGLTVVSHAVAALGGVLEIDSKKNRGSEFVVRIPLES